MPHMRPDEYYGRANAHMKTNSKGSEIMGYVIQSPADPAYRLWSMFFADQKLTSCLAFMRQRIEQGKCYMVPENDPSKFDVMWNPRGKGSRQS